MAEDPMPEHRNKSKQPDVNWLNAVVILLMGIAALMIFFHLLHGISDMLMTDAVAQ